MEAKFTKGEWYKMNATQMGVPFIIASGNETLFQVYGENAEHNANLALAAPEMFEFISSLENDDGSIPKFMWNKRNELLTKITEL